ncbi:MAG: M23 family metallopeptidase [Alphaproteobacteria bacterium]|nr:MAG: M23 family metallopeptidase [Alphaproteobacteria bacterium]
MTHSVNEPTHNEDAQMRVSSDISKSTTSPADALKSHTETPVISAKFAYPLEKSIYAGASKVFTTDGVLITIPKGTPFIAIESGAVIYAGSDPELGNTVIIRHANEWISVYSHASTVSVSTGSLVKKGQILGKSGQTGKAKRPQLHLEIRHNNHIISPKNIYRE